MKAMNGFNGCIFSYGQTGSGKTWSMMGCPEDPGITKRCVDDIFLHIELEKKRNAEIQFTLKVSYLEVYNEEINDLLNDDQIKGRNLRITSDDPNKGGVQIGGLTERECDNANDILGVIEQGEKNRSYGATEMNANSSRSHTLYRLYIESSEEVEVDAGGPGEFKAVGAKASGGPATKPVVKVSYLNLVDLAGSERQKSTGAKGSQLKEGANINKSLLTLGSVIQKLGEASKAEQSGAKPSKKGNFIPYRDSKLTRILKQSLGGNSVTSILCAMTAAPMYHEETVSTLKFGQLCKAIKNKPKSNSTVDDKILLRQYRTQIAQMREQLTGFEAQLKEARADTVEAQKKLEQAEADAKAAAEAAKVDDAARVRLEQEQEKVARQKARADDLEIKMKQEIDKARKESEAQFNQRLNSEKKKLEDTEQDMIERMEQNDEEVYKCKEKEEKLATREEHLNDMEHRLKVMANKQEQEQAELTKRFNTLDEMHSELMQVRYEVKKQFKEWDMMKSGLKHEERKQWSMQIDLDNRKVEMDEIESKIVAERREMKKERDAIQSNLNDAKNKNLEADKRQKQLGSDEQNLKNEKEELEARTKVLESLSFDITARDAAAERADADLKRREEALKISTEKYESNASALQVQQKYVHDQQEKQAIREKRVAKSEQETDKLRRETEKRANRLKAQEENLAKDKEVLEALREKLEASESLIQEQQKKLELKESELFEREEKASDMEHRYKDVMRLEEELMVKRATVKTEEDEFLRIKATVINGKNARELKHVTELLDETSAQCRRVQDEKASVLRERNKLEDEVENLQSELDRWKREAEQSGQLTDYVPRMLHGMDARDNTDDINEESTQLQKHLFQNISQTESLLRFTLMAHDRKPVASRYDVDEVIRSMSEKALPSSNISSDILSDIRHVLKGIEEGVVVNSEVNRLPIHRLKRFVSQFSSNQPSPSFNKTSENDNSMESAQILAGNRLRQRRNQDINAGHNGTPKRAVGANAPPPVPSSSPSPSRLSRTERKPTPLARSTASMTKPKSTNRSAELGVSRPRGGYSNVPVAKVSLDLSEFSASGRKSTGRSRQAGKA